MRSDEKRGGRGWRKPLVVTADADIPQWVDFAVTCVMIAGLATRFGLLAFVPFWALFGIRRLLRRPALELSKEGVRLLRGPVRTIPWGHVARFHETGWFLRFEETPPGARPIPHVLRGVPSGERFRAAALFRAQTAANVFD